MGRKAGQSQPLAAVGSGRCLRWRCVRFPAALLAAAAAAAAAAAPTSPAAPAATAATPFAGGLPLAVLPWLSSVSFADALAFLLHLTPNPVKQQARRGARKRKAPAASPTFQPRSASSPDFVPSGGQFVERNRGNQEGILKEVRQITGVTDSKSTGGATNSSGSRAGNEDGLAVGTSKKGAK